MRETILLLLASAVLVVAGGAAWAANVQGAEGDDVLYGTESRDTVIPFDGKDAVYAL